MVEFVLVLLAALLLGWPLGHYLAAVLRGAPMRGDRIFLWLERPLYALLGTDPARGMSWRGYVAAFLWSNLFLGVLVWLLLMTQAWLPLNPAGVPNLRWDLALHTMLSFLTNTNQQHYAGQAQLSYLAQMVCVGALQVVTPMMALALAAATLRGFAGAKGDVCACLSGRSRTEVAVGNYWADVVRMTLRVMLPLCLLWSVLLTSQGVPATLAASPQAVALETQQQTAGAVSGLNVPLGPVAPVIAAKQLGTNGGGWYGPNSAMPLENPTPLSNLLETLALVLLPVAVVCMIGPLTGRRRFGALVFGTMLVMSLASGAFSVWAETASAAPDPALVMEGKEVRLGVLPSVLWSALTTQTSNGSVNAMLDSQAPLSGLAAIGNMLVNAIWGGIGCGLMQFLSYLLLAVFLAGLMTGRTPAIFGRRIELPEVRLLALLVLLQPVLLLSLTAVTLALPGLAGTSNPGFHGVSQVFYEYASAFANNGSGFEGLQDGSVWWNLSTSVALVAGRYPALIIPLAIAAMLAAKRPAPEGAGSLSIETPTFALTLMAVIAILALLQFMPVLVLGPVADHLTLLAH